MRILIPGDNKEVIMKEESKPDSTKETKKFLEISSDTAHVINKSQPEVKKEEQKKWWPFNKNKDSETSKIDEKKKPETKKTGIFGKNRNGTNAKPQSEAKTGEPKKLPPTRSCQRASPVGASRQVTMPPSPQRKSKSPTANAVGT